ncbi:MAG: coproporphyrinogen dehydrogenase HemZ [Ruminococcaceae bacterium]|nr:coproporphyrinogen dehydrogenase HemZ [Oscillospiraceae bacterium]
MILKINGNIKPYYVQTLAMMFFPGAKFPENEEMTPETVVVSLDLSENDEAVTASLTISQGEKISSAEACAKWDSDDKEHHRKVAAGDAFMKAGADFTGFTPPWGILTGVRPAKVATELLERGMTQSEAAEFISREYFAEPIKARLAVDVAAAEAKVITPEIRRECSVYVGIPFCPTRCAYCSFVSYTSPGLLKLIPDYLTALAKDIGGIFSLIREIGMNVTSIYIGGGTPTILNESQLDFLLDTITKNVTSVREFTLEAGRPDTITPEKLATAAKYGVDRVSVNTQTLNDDVLKKIGRAHSTDMFFSAYDAARASGIKNINVDLIAGLPYDTTESFVNTIDRVIALDPENITVHTFSVKRSSDFKSEGRFDPSSQIASESVAYSQKALTKNGYLPYYMYRQKNTVGNLENVGYAKEGCEGLYNIYMMEEVHSIFASGASSVTKLVSVPDREGNVRIERVFQPKYPYEYLRSHNEDNGSDAKRKYEEMRDQAIEFFDCKK